MGRFLLRFAAFGLFCLPLYGLAVVLIEHYGPDYLQDNLPFPERGNGMLYSRLREVKTVGSVDVLVLGSSHAYRGYDPRIFAEADLSLFNLGSSNQTPLQTEVLLRRYLDRLSPRLVLLDVYPWSFTGDGLEATLDLLANDRRLSGSGPLLWRQGNAKALHAWFLALHRRWGGGFDRLTTDAARSSDTYVAGGYVERQPDRFDGSGAGVEPLPAWNDKQFLALGRCLRLLRERGVPVLLVQSPVTAVQRASYGDGRGFDRRMDAAAAPYLDWAQGLPLDDRRHFFDAHHLNQEGVVIFNRALLREIDRRGLLQGGQ